MKFECVRIAVFEISAAILLELSTVFVLNCPSRLNALKLLPCLEIYTRVHVCVCGLSQIAYKASRTRKNCETRRGTCVVTVRGDNDLLRNSGYVVYQT